MRLVVLVAAIVIAWAAIITLNASLVPPKFPHVIAATILTLGVAVQRINGIQRWLSTPKNKREENVELFAQTVLIRVCHERRITTQLLGLRIHVWEVPLWYRRVFPYWLRRALKRAAKKRPIAVLARFTLRPAFRRVASVGLSKQPPSGVRFRKSVGIVGVCVANNDRGELLTLDIDDPSYRAALKLPTEAEWLGRPPEITRNLSLADANKLSHTYGQVIARVVQDLKTGEAIGCVTISLKAGGQDQSLLLAQSNVFERALVEISEGVALHLA